MKTLYLILLVLLFALPSFSQNCSSDSVVKTLVRDRGDDFLNTFETYSFDVVNGVELYSMAPFTRRYLTFNTNHDTLQLVLMNGTGSGYTNFKRIDFNYNASNLILSRMEFYGTGLVWNLLKTEIWNYNGSNLKTDYTLIDTSGNVSKEIHSYSGNIRQSILYQKGSGTTWINDHLYNIIYSGGTRDSLVLKKWEPSSMSWIDSIASKYTLFFDFVATLADTNDQGTNTYINSLSFDTLDRVLREYNSDSAWGGFYESHSYTYSYIHSHKVVSSYRLTTMDCVNSDQDFSYDQYGVEISRGYEGHCGIGSGGGYSMTYDSAYRLISKDSYSYSSVSGASHYWDYYYFSPDSIILNYIPLGTLGQNISCMGDSIQPTLLVGGGCGPFTYSWTPTTGLSSSNIAQPFIAIGNDTLTYSITVTDTTGHSGITTFQAFPKFSAVISFDTSACPGCPVLLQANIVSGASYQWYRNDTVIDFANQSAYVAINSGNYSVRISKQSCQIYSDTLALTLSGLTRINGNVYWDRDSDCVNSVADTALSIFGFTPFLIDISRPNYQITVSLDSNGHYDIPIDTGAFVVRLHNPSQMLTPLCTGADSIVVYIPAFGDTISGNDFPLKGDTTCKRLEVRISTTQFRPCQNAGISVRYFNASLTAENNASVKVNIPSELNVTIASLPYTVSGNEYTFTLPLLSIGESGVITISADVVCNTGLTSATLCIDAEITPKDLCSLNPDSSYDGSNIRISSYCNNDSSACFTITNESLLPNGNMSDSSAWRLYKNNVIYQQGNFILTANSDTTLCFLSDGSTYRMEANQTNGFPVLGRVISSIERCGPDTNSYMLGQILNHYTAQQLPFYDTYCRRITNSFDPNIKSVQPEGLGPDHYIASGQLMKYRIDFQNTGTDTALYVEIRDHFSPNLDPNSIRFIGSSHLSQIELIDRDVKWKFYNINLPDSNTNEQASHGYVEFEIRSYEGIQNGAIVANYANIYFDFNPPIQTPVVRNTICNIFNPSVTIRPDTGFCIGTILKCRATILPNGYFPGPVINWYVNGVMQSTHRDSLTYSGIKLNDTIVCTIQNSSLCAFPSMATSNTLIFDTYSIPIPAITFNTPELASSVADGYQWYYNDTIIIGGIFQNFTPLNDGIYTVQVWDSSGCTAISNPFAYIGVGMKDEANPDLKVFPNPALDYLHIQYKDAMQSIKVVDAIGNTFYFQKINSNSATIHLQDLKSGSYLLDIFTSEGHLYKRFTIIRQ